MGRSFRKKQSHENELIPWIKLDLKRRGNRKLLDESDKTFASCFLYWNILERALFQQRELLMMSNIHWVIDLVYHSLLISLRKQSQAHEYFFDVCTCQELCPLKQRRQIQLVTPTRIRSLQYELGMSFFLLSYLSEYQFLSRIISFERTPADRESFSSWKGFQTLNPLMLHCNTI